MNFCGFFDVYNLYITQKKIFFAKILFAFTWLIWGTILKKFWKFFFKLEDWDRLQTTGNFVLYHVPEFHQDCSSTFLAILISKFQFIRQKSKKNFQGVCQKLSIPPINPKIGQKLPLTYLGIVRKFQANQKNFQKNSPKNGGRGQGRTSIKLLGEPIIEWIITFR